MNNLILDCAAGMSLFVEKNGVVFSKIDLNQKKHTDELLVALDELLVNAKLQVKDIDNLCVCVGPGSFTGIRVAVSIAKGLAVPNNFKIFELSNFDIYSAENCEKFALVLVGFSDYVYVRKVNGKNKNESCEKISDFANWAKENQDYKIFVQNEKLQNLLKNLEINSKIGQNQTIFAFNQKIKANENILLEQINPIYLRGSQAEIEREKKLAGQKSE
jgi:tRNA threonylcarbamoyl adenosine modification protein YeaZ